MRDERQYWLDERDKLALELESSPYNIHIYLQRARSYKHLGYPDLCASDTYRALLLTDEVLDEEGEFHQQAVDTIENARKSKSNLGVDGCCRNGRRGLASPVSVRIDQELCTRAETAEEAEHWYHEVAYECALESYQMLASALSECGDLKSAYEFTRRGLIAFVGDEILRLTQKDIVDKYRKKQIQQDPTWDDSLFNPKEDLRENGLVRREIYPWNMHEPDRLLPEHLSFINGEVRKSAPQCEVRVTELPVLDGDPSFNALKAATVRQLGLFSTSTIPPGQSVLLEPSVLTSSTRLHDPVCDACSAGLPSWPNDPLPACPSCEDIVFCSQDCLDRAQSLYHPAVCGIGDFDIVAKDPSAFSTTSALYTLLIARTMAMAETQGVNPLNLPQIKYLWGDYSDSTTRSLPFSFSNNIAQPLHLLSRLDKDPFCPRTLACYDTWVINTLLAKFRGTANARMNERTGLPEVAGVHWLWSLANHSCAPNVRWE